MTNKDRVVQLAIKSLIVEVSLCPKPGLVDPLDNGAHSDMDFYTFIDSVFALIPGFNEYYETGNHHDGSLRELFDTIRHVGMKSEKAMYDATNKINTHKGANFLYGVVIAAIAHLNNPSLDTLQEAIKKMTQGLVYEELESLKEFKTHGERVFKDYGFTGIRGEVENGLPMIYDYVLPILNDNHFDYDTRLKRALLTLIRENNDSNMLKRGGFEGLQKGKKLASMNYTDLDDHLLMMNSVFIEENLSPGGSADLLALSIFLKMYDETLVNS